jgi:uncharacterized protein (TIGR00255 family)
MKGEFQERMSHERRSPLKPKTGAPAAANLRSMTGFGRAQIEDDLGRFGVEIRCVNGRFHESRVSLPPPLAALESPLRNLLRERVARGKLDCRVRFTPAAGRAPGARFNESLILDYQRRLGQIARRAGRAESVSVEALLALPGAIEPIEEPNDAEVFMGPIARALGLALDQFNAEREREGRALGEQIARESALLRALAARIADSRETLLQKYREKLAARIAELQGQIGASVDSGRLEIEVALFADRCDISEEMTRLVAHLDRLDALVRNPSGEPVGKPLDFLLQEILREVNTTASKLRDVDRVADALEMKGAVERIREQIQNLE